LIGRRTGNRLRLVTSLTDATIRRHELLAGSLAVVLAIAAVTCWVMSADRGELDTFVVWAGACALANVGFMAILTGRRPRLSWFFRRRRSRSKTDLASAFVPAVLVSVLLTTSYQWLPGISDIPDSWIPASVIADRDAIVLVLVSAIMVVLWIASSVVGRRRGNVSNRDALEPVS